MRPVAPKSVIPLSAKDKAPSCLGTKPTKVSKPVASRKPCNLKSAAGIRETGLIMVAGEEYFCADVIMEQFKGIVVTCVTLWSA